MNKTQWKNIAIWILRIIPALILLQSLFFKFTGVPEAVAIFTTIGIEPWGRFIIGIAELITAILLLIPRTTYLGALGGIGLMIGAIYFHLTSLGVVVANDGGLLFALAIVVLVTSGLLLFITWQKNLLPKN